MVTSKRKRAHAADDNEDHEEQHKATDTDEAGLSSQDVDASGDNAQGQGVSNGIESRDKAASFDIERYLDVYSGLNSKFSPAKSKRNTMNSQAAMQLWLTDDMLENQKLLETVAGSMNDPVQFCKRINEAYFNDRDEADEEQEDLEQTRPVTRRNGRNRSTANSAASRKRQRNTQEKASNTRGRNAPKPKNIPERSEEHSEEEEAAEEINANGPIEEVQEESEDSWKSIFEMYKKLSNKAKKLSWLDNMTSFLKYQDKSFSIGTTGEGENGQVGLSDDLLEFERSFNGIKYDGCNEELPESWKHILVLKERLESHLETWKNNYAMFASPELETSGR